MRTTTYKCDHCGAEDTTNAIELQIVGVHVGAYRERYSYPSDPSATVVSLDQEWCRDCRLKAGLVPDRKESQAETPVTLDDLVREIARDEARYALDEMSQS